MAKAFSGNTQIGEIDTAEHGVVAAGQRLLNTLLTLRGTDESFFSAVLGIIMSGYFVGFICGIWVSGRLIRRMGHIRTFGFCASICASVALLHLIFVSPWVWFPARRICWSCMALAVQWRRLRRAH